MSAQVTDLRKRPPGERRPDEIARTLSLLRPWDHTARSLPRGALPGDCTPRPRWLEEASEFARRSVER